ncbi:hypothetical protein [Halomarina oriensis]|uniref:Uncharacterized protein n=1 Tax=Halomarina oriensis TaxID=671145 RepID=A0A6B0GSB8_9EURY|nr:hypothetical protein [Halomarina oriensis]MWG36207.1 hypothetical protein [Halomarina oriensis]
MPLSPELSTTDWLTVLEAIGGELYVTVTDRTDDFDVRWFVRHDGVEWVYGTQRTGELYRGDRNSRAFRNLEAVLDNEAENRPRPMTDYPLDIDHSRVWDSDG